MERTEENIKHICRVCGFFDETDYPYGEDLKTPIFEFCICCGAQHGYNDMLPETAKKYRENWISNGAKWNYPKEKPNNWDLNYQLQNLDLLKYFYS